MNYHHYYQVQLINPSFTELTWTVVFKHCASFFRSRGVASVSAKASFNPDKINIFNKPCDINGRKLTCFTTNLCFSAAFRPKNPVGPLGKSHDLFVFLGLCCCFLLNGFVSFRQSRASCFVLVFSLS